MWAQVDLPDFITTGMVDIIVDGLVLHIRTDAEMLGSELPVGTWLRVDHDDPPPGHAELGSDLLAQREMSSLLYWLLGQNGKVELLGVEPSGRGELTHLRVPVELDQAIAGAPAWLEPAFERSVAAFRAEGGTDTGIDRADVWIGDDGLIHRLEYVVTYDLGGARMPTVIRVDLFDHGQPIHLPVPDAAEVIDAWDLWAGPLVEAPTDGLVDRQVLLPDTQIAVTVPGGWRVQPELVPRSGEVPSLVINNLLRTFDGCSLAAYDVVVPLEESAARYTDAIEADPTTDFIERSDLTLAVGPAVRVDSRDLETGRESSSYTIAVGDMRILVACSAPEAPADRWLSVVESLAVLTPDEAESVQSWDEGTEPRIEMPHIGFSVEFGDDWVVRGDTRPASHQGSRAVLRAFSVDAECIVEDHSRVPWLAGESEIEAMHRPFAEEYVIDTLKAEVRASTCQDLPAGRACRVDFLKPGLPAFTVWSLTDGNTWLRLTCHSDDPPDDRWLSIAETIEFLDAPDT
jgi:hypothetical protein